jgi:hypothetical protein
MSDDGFIPGIVIGALLASIIWGFIMCSTDISWRSQIVDHGCAHFYLDAHNERQWDWVEHK